ncbi:unnamed protein product [Linum trigynum]|uniref:Retrotransposon Copia-like N-terminal domain-containing protein n=1 Tax=Linum trigynum TaxID=586398 RepID=A0AAV2DW85_9ROSI
MVEIPSTLSGGNTCGILFGSYGDQSNTIGQYTNTNNARGPSDPEFGNPFYINANENLAQPTIPIVLDGPNYQMCSRVVRVVLKTKYKLGFIDESIPILDRNDDMSNIWDA